MGRGCVSCFMFCGVFPILKTSLLIFNEILCFLNVTRELMSLLATAVCLHVFESLRAGGCEAGQEQFVLFNNCLIIVNKILRIDVVACFKVNAYQLLTHEQRTAFKRAH